MQNSYQEAIAAAFQDELVKIAEHKSALLSPATVKALGFAGAGALGYHTVTQANKDRRLGKTMRMQQGY